MRDKGATRWTNVNTARWEMELLPNHAGNLHEALRLEWSFLHLQSENADVEEPPMWRFCWACGSRPETHCLSPAAWRAEQQPLSSVGKKSCYWRFFWPFHCSSVGVLCCWRSHPFVIQMDSTDFKVEHKQLGDTSKQKHTKKYSCWYMHVK